MAPSISNLMDDPGLPVPNSTKSFWQQPLREDMAGLQSRKLPSLTDVVIIGAGITGCSVASTLLNNDPSVSVTVLEAREVCSGATGRNGGRINCVAVQDYDKYKKLFGHEAAVKIVRFSLAHFEALAEIAKEAGKEVLDASEVREVGTVAAVFEDDKLADLTRMLADFETAFPDLKGRWRISSKEETVQKYHIAAAKGALIGTAGAAWPYRLITGVFASLLTRFGSRFSIETNTPALSIQKDSSAHPYKITTPRGILAAKHIVHCTEGHASHLLPQLRGILVPRRGQMTVQHPGTAFPQKHGENSWSFYFPSGFDYLTQNARTGDLFVGGGDMGGADGYPELLGIASDAEEVLSAKSHLGGVLPVAFGDENWGPEAHGKPRMKSSWTGIMCNSLDHVPLVGMLPDDAIPRHAGDSKGAEWISAGYGGYGMVNAWLSGKAVANMLQGQDVSSWLPDNYNTSPQRIRRLKSKVAELQKDSPLHCKSLM